MKKKTEKNKHGCNLRIVNEQRGIATVKDMYKTSFKCAAYLEYVVV